MAPTTLQIATVFEPSATISRCAARVSAVSPDCVINRPRAYIMQVFDLQSTWFWKNIVARVLLGTVPGSWFNVAHFDAVDVHGPEAFSQVVNLQAMYSVLLTPQLWLGVLAGAGMIFAAIRLRRWRDEG